MEFPENMILSPIKKKNAKTNENKITLKQKQNPQFPKNSYDYELNLSQKDIKIAKILSENAKIPFSKIAKQVGISTNSVISKYKQLRKQNLISKSTITLNLQKLGYKAILVIFLKASPLSNATKLYNQVIKMPNVIVAIRLLGQFDLMIDVLVNNFSEVFQLREKLYDIKGIEKVEVEFHAPFTRWPLNIWRYLLDKTQPV